MQLDIKGELGKILKHNQISHRDQSTTIVQESKQPMLWGKCQRFWLQKCLTEKCQRWEEATQVELTDFTKFAKCSW